MTNLPQRETTCPICRETWEALQVTYQTWIAHPYDPYYSAAHDAAVQAYLRHRLTGHLQASHGDTRGE